MKRKGACKNCGAMGHTAKDCVERPRSNKKTAEKTGLDIAPDDVRTELASHGKVGGCLPRVSPSPLSRADAPPP